MTDASSAAARATLNDLKPQLLLYVGAPAPTYAAMKWLRYAWKTSDELDFEVREGPNESDLEVWRGVHVLPLAAVGREVTNLLDLQVRKGCNPLNLERWHRIGGTTKGSGYHLDFARQERAVQVAGFGDSSGR